MTVSRRENQKRKGLKMNRYMVYCEWKGKEGKFEVWAENYAFACETARQMCKKATKLPMSSIQKVVWLGEMKEE